MKQFVFNALILWSTTLVPCLLPIMINDFLEAGTMRVRAEESPDRWFGLTYRGDMLDVREELKRLCDTGFYPAQLF